jgi:glycosyltransferase involved in cell wall biosynthesis
MHLVFLNQYYPPDAAPTGVMLKALVEGLLEDGHEVTVLCAAGGYAGAQAGRVKREDIGIGMEEETRKRNEPAVPSSSTDPQSPMPRLRIVRIGATKFGRGSFVGKLLDYASYFAGVAWKLLTMRPVPQRIVALTTPPYLSVLARLVSKLRGADHAHWVMDLYPDVMAAHGMLDERGRLYRMLAGLTRWGFGGKRCAAVLTLGPDMAERVGARVGKKVQWVPLWGTGEDRVVACQLSEKVQEIKTQDPREEGRRNVNLEHSPSNLEPRTEEDCEGRVERPRSADSSPAGWDANDPALAPFSQGESGSAEAVGPDLLLAPALALRRQRGWADEEVVVMYSGNMGLGHRFGEILAAAKELLGKGGDSDLASGMGDCDEGEPKHGAQAPQASDNGQPRTGNSLRLVFFGGGKRRGEVEKFVRENPECGVELHDYAPAQGLAAHLQSADVHLASLDPAWSGTMVPSKVQGIFGAGRSVIFIGSPVSSIARWVNASGGGWVLEPGDLAGLLDALAEARDPTVRAIRGRAAKVFAGKHFDQRTNVARVVEILTGSR